MQEDGTATVATDLPFGSYYIKEMVTDEHYILNDEQYAFTFDYAGQDTETVEIKVNDEKPIENRSRSMVLFQVRKWMKTEKHLQVQ